jgi:hypothetical protein
VSAAPQNVIWIHSEKPTFDLIGVVLSSFGIAGICVGVALLLGACWGLVLIRRGRNGVPLPPELGLGPDAAARS